MPPLAAIERFFERLFERPSARLFRTHVQPVQIQHRIERAMEGGRRPTGERTLVPNRFVVHLNAEDLAGFEGIADDLAAELADEALTFARAHRYALASRPRVDLLADPAVDRSDIRVEARFTSAAEAAALDGQPAEPDGAPDERGTGTHGPGEHDAGDATATRVFTVPQSRAPRAVLRIVDPDGSRREVAIEGGELTIGRADDNHLVARDGRVSRHHARIVGRRGTLIYQDLGSTNGSKVNGERVGEVVLGVGDRLEIGDTELTLEVAEEPT